MKAFFFPLQKSILTFQHNPEGCVWSVIVAVFPRVWHSHSCSSSSEVWCESHYCTSKNVLNNELQRPTLRKKPASAASSRSAATHHATDETNTWAVCSAMLGLRFRAPLTSVTLPQLLKSDHAHSTYIPRNNKHSKSPKYHRSSSRKEV